jgi:ribosomal protein L44E
MMQADKQYQASIEHLEGTCAEDCPFCEMEENMNFEDSSKDKKTSLGKAERQIKRRD